MKKGDIVWPYIFAKTDIMGTIKCRSSSDNKDWVVSFTSRLGCPFTVEFKERELELVRETTNEGG